MLIMLLIYMIEGPIRLKDAFDAYRRVKNGAPPTARNPQNSPAKAEVARTAMQRKNGQNPAKRKACWLAGRQ